MEFVKEYTIDEKIYMDEDKIKLEVAVELENGEKSQVSIVSKLKEVQNEIFHIHNAEFFNEYDLYEIGDIKKEIILILEDDISNIISILENYLFYNSLKPIEARKVNEWGDQKEFLIETENCCVSFVYENKMIIVKAIITILKRGPFIEKGYSFYGEYGILDEKRIKEMFDHNKIRLYEVSN